MNEVSSQQGYYSGPDRAVQNEAPRGLIAGEALPPLIPPKPRIRQIQIEALDYGFIVRCGCQTLAIEDKGTLIAKLTEYISDPVATEAKYNEGKLF